jgi:hypothetical protein
MTRYASDAADFSIAHAVLAVKIHHVAFADAQAPGGIFISVATWMPLPPTT